MVSPENPTPNFSTTLAKGMKILEAFNANATQLSNQELSAITGISRPTVARLTSTLMELGYLKKQKSKYRMSWPMVPLANPLRGKTRILEAADDAMKRMATEFGGTLSVGTINRLDFMYLKTVRSRENIWGGPDVGVVGPALPTAIGWALCSLMTQAELDEFTLKLAQKMPETWAGKKRDFYVGITACLTNGFCMAEGAFHPDLATVAVPVSRDLEGDFFAINFRVPRYMLGKDQLEEEIAPRLKALSSHIRDMMSAHDSDDQRIGFAANLPLPNHRL